MLPILLFEVAWKLLWLGVDALPLWSQNKLEGATLDQAGAIGWVVIADDLVVIGNGRIVAQGSKHDLLRSPGSIVRATDREIVARALVGSHVTFSPVGQDGLLADAEQVGRIAFAAGIPLIELRPAAGAGLEALFLELTAETQRDTTGASDPQRAPVALT
jgi:hypothetical protein